MPRLSRAQLALIPTLSLSLALTACQPPVATTPSGSTAPAAMASASTLLGRAVLVDPLVGATLKLIALDGAVAKEYPNATNENGAFAVEVPEGLKDFRVEAHPVAGAPERQNGVLAVEVRGFSADNHLAYLNPVSTVVSHRLAQNPGSDLAAIEADARLTFALPAEADLGPDLDDNEFFDEAAFVQAAKASGGFNSHVGNVAKTLGSAPLKAQLGNPVADAAKAAAKSMLMDIGKDLAKKYSDKPVIGFLLTKAFVTDEDKFRDEVKAALAEQNKKLNEINERLTMLQGEVSAIKDALKEFQRQTGKDLGLIDYNTSIDPLVTHFARLDSLYTDLRTLTLLNPTPEIKARIRDLRATIMRDVPTIVDTLFKAEFEDVAGRIPSMKRWAKVAGNATPGFPTLIDGGQFTSKLRSQREYFETYQAMGAILIVEALNDGTENGLIEATSRYNTIMDRLSKQEAATYLPEVGNGVIISPRAGLMWSRKLWAPDAAKPDQYWYSFTRSPRSFSPVDPEQALKAARIEGLGDWRLPNTAELATLNPNHYNPVGGTGLSMELMQNLKFDFAWDKHGWNLNKLWTSDTSGTGGVVKDLSQGRSYPVGNTNFVVLPVRSIPVWSEP